ncbi:DUF1173 family protein [Pelagibaculum spongiae]|uniref:DUF1173 domain-containing protein n=1 Tax=Pelagibaculum spongiae TaxID=2080658 RepID=A0A2V1GXD8_9GAMM|nr:DUF1173 family protein [Pelagibaculum spongiae]PVZ64515.1 hypothetical protein DC094_19575 [Pelagibaculum spongiae]
MTKYAIGGGIFERSDSLIEAVLSQAHQSRERPRCLCKTPGLPMYIARTSDNHFLLKRMSNSGQSHHPDCESYEIPPELSGRGAVAQTAITESHESGFTNLKLDFALSKLSLNRTIVKGESQEATSVRSDPAKLSIRSLLHCLYEDAGLNKWSPKMEDKRSWYIIRKYLLQAAQSKLVRNHPLAETLLIPEQFSLNYKDDIVARRRQFLSRLKKQGNKQPMGILIGEVKAIEKARFGFKMIVKHMPDTPVYLGEDTYKRIAKIFSKELAFFHENESIHLLAICTFCLSASGSPQVDTISFMTVDQSWLAFESIEELELIERLRHEKRHFIKGLRYNLNEKDIIASLLLTDTKQQPTAVYLVPAGASESYYDELNTIVESSDLYSKVLDVNQKESHDII